MWNIRVKSTRLKERNDEQTGREREKENKKSERYWMMGGTKREIVDHSNLWKGS